MSLLLLVTSSCVIGFSTNSAKGQIVLPTTTSQDTTETTDTPVINNNLVTVESAREAGKKISAGDYHSLVLKNNGRVVAWGYDFDGQCTVPAEAWHNIIAVAAGGYHSLALKSDGTVIAWGKNEHGQCNIPVAALHNVTAITAGGSHSLALNSDGSVVAWGNNKNGQCDVPVEAQSDVVEITAGDSHSLALKSDGSVIAWGKNDCGQCNIPEFATSDVAAVSAGQDFSLAIKSDGSLIKWGGPKNLNYFDAEFKTKKNIVAISAGCDYFWALKSNSRIVTWGMDYFGQLGTNLNLDSYDIAAISAGFFHTVVLFSDGDVSVFGDNDVHQCTDEPRNLNINTTEAPTKITLTIGQNTATKNENLCTMDVKPYIDLNTGNIMIPLRFVCEALGAHIEWPSANSISIKDKQHKTIHFMLNSKQAYVDGGLVNFDYNTCRLQPGRTFVPLHFFSDNLRAKVEFNEITKEIMITRYN